MAIQKSTQRRLPIRMSPAARAMIRQRQLGGIIAIVERAVGELYQAGVPINWVEIERTVDPEIEGLNLLSVTAWMPEAAADEALAARKRLLKVTREGTGELGPAETEKLSKLVSVGVDVE